MRGVWLAAGYQRYLAFFGGPTPIDAPPAGGIPFAQGLPPNAIFQVVSLRAWGDLTKRVGIQGGVQRAVTGVDAQGHGVKSGIGQLHLDYRLNPRLVFFTRVEYYGQSINEFVQSAISRKRLLGGIEIAVSRPPEPADRLNRFAPFSADATGEPQALEPDVAKEK